MTVVTFALPSESSDFVRLLQKRTRLADDSATILGSIEGKSVSVIHTGVGAEAARKRIAALLQKQRPDRLISAGFAGGLTDRIPAGAILLGQNFSSPDLLRAAGAALRAAGAQEGKLISVNAVVHSVRERQEAARTHAADAADMETGSIAQLCADAGVPMLSVRAISDTPAAPFPAPPEILFDLQQQRTRFTPLFLYLVKNPIAAVRLVNFALQISATRRALAAALHQLFRCDLIPDD